MAEFRFRHSYPIWVRISLWGSSSRTDVWGYVWVCIILAVCCCVAGAVQASRFYVGALCAFWGALLYWLSIRWVDKHGRW